MTDPPAVLDLVVAGAILLAVVRLIYRLHYLVTITDRPRQSAGAVCRSIATLLWTGPGELDSSADG